MEPRVRQFLDRHIPTPTTWLAANSILLLAGVVSQCDTKAVANHSRRSRERIARLRLDAELLGFIGPRKMAQLFKIDPRLWLRLITHLGVPFALYGGVLAAVGKLDDFGTWAIAPGMWGALSLNADLRSVWREHRWLVRRGGR